VTRSLIGYGRTTGIEPAHGGFTIHCLDPLGYIRPPLATKLQNKKIEISTINHLFLSYLNYEDTNEETRGINFQTFLYYIENRKLTQNNKL
jgi:hypothetical protein